MAKKIIKKPEAPNTQLRRLIRETLRKELEAELVPMVIRLSHMIYALPAKVRVGTRYDLEEFLKDWEIRPRTERPSDAETKSIQESIDTMFNETGQVVSKPYAGEITLPEALKKIKDKDCPRG